MLGVRIAATGLSIPPRVETAQDLGPRIGKSPEWIARHTGVLRRHISDRSMAEQGADAAREALGNGGPPDLVINASLTPIQLIPDSSIFIMKELGFEGIPGFSVHSTCLSFLVALQVAANFVQLGQYHRVLVISSEQGSVCRDFGQPESASLIGDGAAAAIVEPTPPGSTTGIIGFAMKTWPSGGALTELRGCGTRRHPNNPETVSRDNLFQMSGPRIYKMALQLVPTVILPLLQGAQLAPADIDLVVAHQASGQGMVAYERLGFTSAQIFNVVAEYGNCIAASIPMALALALREGRIQPGNRVLLMGLGAGLSVAGALLRW
jgi:3-oxoacyl-[acyl-carrier-protein] synthase III